MTEDVLEEYDGPDGFRRFEQAGWERAASFYEDYWADLTRSFVPALLQPLDLAPGMRLLDLCCGPGDVSSDANRRGATTLGLDFAEAMVVRARERHPGLDFRVGDAQRLPFGPQSFDAVAMNFGILHLAEPEAVVAEAGRVLRPGGRFAFTVWARPEVNTLARIVEDAVAAHADPDVGLPQGPDSCRFADAAECREAFAKAGLQSLSFETATVEWPVPTTAFLFEAERVGGVRTAGLLRRQTPERLAAIRAAMEEGVARHPCDGGFAIPAAAHVVVAVAPSGSLKT